MEVPLPCQELLLQYLKIIRPNAGIKVPEVLIPYTGFDIIN